VIGIQGRNERRWPMRRATAGTAGRRAGTRITAGFLSREVQRAQAVAERDREQQWGCVHRLFRWGVVKRGRWPDRTLTMGLGLRPETGPSNSGRKLKSRNSSQFMLARYTRRD
jgi:hypothetical protein